MADLGAISLWIALALSSYAVLGSLLGKIRGVPALEESARWAVRSSENSWIRSRISAFVSVTFPPGQGGTACPATHETFSPH